MADPVSGELVIVPDETALTTITGDTYLWQDAVDFAAAYDDGTNSDYRLITIAEAEAILGNSWLVGQLGLPNVTNYWTIEETAEPGTSYYSTPIGVIDAENATEVAYYALPVRKENFYGLPLIESEFGGGLVYDVVAETRTVHVAAKWEDVISAGYEITYDWLDALHFSLFPVPVPSVGEIFTDIPTRAHAMNIFENSYLVSLLGLPLDNEYWTNEEVDSLNAYIWAVNDDEIQEADKTNLHYALPVRSEVVPET